MNTLTIFAPRWKDRTVLLAAWKVGTLNKVVITTKKKDGTLYFPEPLYITGEMVRTFPIEVKVSPNGKFYVVPLMALEARP